MLKSKSPFFIGVLAVTGTSVTRPGLEVLGATCTTRRSTCTSLDPGW
jgi:hypothetical protein